ncbi:MAG: nucleotidyltransferase family protein [Ghiorsea sp.]
MNDLNRAVILAAGKGTRLKSLTQDKPKALMPIGDEPAIYHVIRHLVGQGIHEIAINIHHHAQQLRDDLGNGAKFNAHLYYSPEPNLLDSGGGVRTALSLLPDGEAVAVYNADIMSSINLQSLSKICPKQGCSLALVENPKHNFKGDFSLQDGRVTHATGQTYTFSGVSVWSEAALSKYPSNTAFPLITPIRELITKEVCIGSVYRDQWFDIGRPRDLIQANRLFEKEVL